MPGKVGGKDGRLTPVQNTRQPSTPVHRKFQTSRQSEGRKNTRGRKRGEGEGKGKRKRREGGRKREERRRGGDIIWKSVELAVRLCYSYSVWRCALRKCAFYESGKRDLDQMPVLMHACQLLVSSHPLALSSFLHLYQNHIQLAGAHSTCL